ncbi:hypothetical protein M378DRAFT_160388, partial [Amanita muscaria Koide BX008]
TPPFRELGTWKPILRRSLPQIVSPNRAITSYSLVQWYSSTPQHAIDDRSKKYS